MKTIKQVAEIFMVSDRTVKRWLSDGRITPIRIGGIVRIPDDEVERLKAGDAIGQSQRN